LSADHLSKLPSRSEWQRLHPSQQAVVDYNLM